MTPKPSKAETTVITIREVIEPAKMVSLLYLMARIAEIFKKKLWYSVSNKNSLEIFFFFFVGQLHKDAPTEEHPGNLTILMSEHFNGNSPWLINTTLYNYKHHLLLTGWCFVPQGEHSTLAGLKTNVGEEVLYIKF